MQIQANLTHQQTQLQDNIDQKLGAFQGDDASARDQGAKQQQEGLHCFFFEWCPHK